MQCLFLQNCIRTFKVIECFRNIKTLLTHYIEKCEPCFSSFFFQNKKEKSISGPNESGEGGSESLGIYFFRKKKRKQDQMGAYTRL